LKNNAWRKSLFRSICRSIELTAALWGIIAFIYYWDPTRIVVKRLMESDSYAYEEIYPRFRGVQVNQFITVRNRDDIGARRQALIDTIWPGDRHPPTRLPDRVVHGAGKVEGNPRCLYEGDEAVNFASLECKLNLYQGIANLSRIDRLEISVGKEYRAVAALFRPKKSNAKVLFYHHGYAGTYHGQHTHLARLIDRGFTVVAFNLPEYGDNIDVALVGLDPKTDLEVARWILEPVIVALNHVAPEFSQDHVSMMGFSAGGWAAVMAAALDSRIRTSFLVASPTYPIEFRISPDFGPKISLINELLEVANYFDLFVLGAAGDEKGERRQLHIYNQFDRCCWRNRTAMLFEQPVKNAVNSLEGKFAVKIDTSHARHKVSRQAFSWILLAMDGGDP